MYQTPDVDLAAFLRLRGKRYEHITSNEGNPTLADFVFTDDQETLDLVHDWNSNEALRWVDAREFGRVRRQLFRNARRFLAGV